MAFPRSQRVFELLLLIDIENNAAEMARTPILIPDQAAAGANPLAGSPFSAFSTKPERNVEIAAGLGNPLDRLFGALAILRFEQGKKQLVGNRLVAGDAEKTSGRIGPLQFSRGKIQIPGSDAKPFNSEPKMLIADRVVWRC